MTGAHKSNEPEGSSLSHSEETRTVCLLLSAVVPGDPEVWSNLGTSNLLPASGFSLFSFSPTPSTQSSLHEKDRGIHMCTVLNKSRFPSTSHLSSNSLARPEEQG